MARNRVLLDYGDNAVQLTALLTGQLPIRNWRAVNRIGNGPRFHAESRLMCFPIAPLSQILHRIESGPFWRQQLFQMARGTGKRVAIRQGSFRKTSRFDCLAGEGALAPLS